MDCSTWFLVENQSKMTYPLPPRFSARGVLWGGCVRVFCWGCVRFFVGWDVAFAPVSARGFDIDSVFITALSGLEPLQSIFAFKAPEHES
jgi:hypothetical protein